MSQVVAKSRSARSAYLSEWLLEFSVLLAVFPLHDQALERRFSLGITGVTLALSVLLFLCGLLLVDRKDH